MRHVAADAVAIAIAITGLPVTDHDGLDDDDYGDDAVRRFCLVCRRGQF